MHTFLPANLYYTVYLLIITFLTVFAIRKKNLPHIKEKTGAAMLTCWFFAWFIGNRPIDEYFADMLGYAISYVYYVSWDGFAWGTENLIFDNMLAFCSQVAGMWVFTFFEMIAYLFFVPAYFACKKLFPNHVYLAFLVWLAAFETFAGATNGMKAGIAGTFGLMALAYRKNLPLSLFLMLLSWGFHHSMHLVIYSYVLTLFFKNPKWYFGGWIFCLLMATFHITLFQELFAGMTDDKGASYLNNSATDGARGGFRIDFIIYSVMPIIMGWYATKKCKFQDKVYEAFLHTYLTCNAIWLLCMYASFTNRIAYLSWFMYPIVLCYPCFKVTDKKSPLYRNRNYIIMGHLGFTIFMHIVYSI